VTWQTNALIRNCRAKSDFWPISCSIDEKVQDRTEVTVDH